MSSNRMGRINEEIQRELATLLRTVKDPRVRDSMISITAVEATGDLRYAKVFFSAFDKDGSDRVLAGLKSASGYLRRAVGQSLNLRYTPELMFERDDSMDKGARILAALKELEE